MLPGLQFFAKLTHSYGWAIIFLTLAVRVVVWPLVAQSTSSMQRMSKLQPQMKVLKDRYGSDPEQLQKKTMEFYAKNKVNPMSSCLPTLIQLPILWALFATFSGPPFADRYIDVKVNVVPKVDAATEKPKETSSSNSAYIGADGKAAKIVVFPGDSTVAVGDSLIFGTRAIEGDLPTDFAPTWKVVGPSNKNMQGPASEKTDAILHEPQEAVPDPLRHLGDANVQHEMHSSPNGKIGRERAIPASEPAKPADVIANQQGHVTFLKPGEYHVGACIPGIAKHEAFLFINGLGKIASGMQLLMPANWDALGLILAFGATMYLSQLFTVATPKPAPGDTLDEQQLVQQQTAKMMPLVATAMFSFVPLPVGVYLYLVLSNIVQTFQTWLLMKTPQPDFVDVTGDEKPLSKKAESQKPESEKPDAQTAELKNGKGNTPEKRTVRLSNGTKFGAKKNLPEKKKSKLKRKKP
jgi:YidC/Oxa1 family membrane protein insertase